MSKSSTIDFKLGQSFLIIENNDKQVKNWLDQKKAEFGLADFWGGIYNSFSIDDARDLKSWHAKKANTPAGKIAIIFAHQFGHEAQNTLLKITEEPHQDTTIILITGSKSNLLPTVLSRLQIVTEPVFNTELDLSLGTKFFKLSPAERLTKIDQFVDMTADTNRIQLEQLMRQLKAITTTNQSLWSTKSVPVLIKAETYTKTTGVPPKTTYEYLALLLPTSK